jgi:hypothetical protein
MGSVEVDVWPLWHNLVRIHIGVAHVVVQLNVLHIAGGFEGRVLVQVSQVTPEVGIVHNSPQVALEVDVVNRVEPIQGGEHADIRFGDAIAAQIPLLIQHSLPVVQRLKQFCYRFFVGPLLGGKSRPDKRHC